MRHPALQTSTRPRSGKHLVAIAEDLMAKKLVHAPEDSITPNTLF
jgi:hypothetical protein